MHIIQLSNIGKKATRIVLSAVLVTGLLPCHAFAQTQLSDTEQSEASQQETKTDSMALAPTGASNSQDAGSASVGGAINQQDAQSELTGVDNQTEGSAALSAQGGEEPEGADASLAVASDCSITTTVDGIEYKLYSDDTSNVLFLPSNADLDNLTMNFTCSKKIVSTSQGTIIGNTIVGSFSNNTTIRLKFSDNSYFSFSIMQSTLNCVSMVLNGTTIEEINSGSKDTKYAGNSISLIEADSASSGTLSEAELSLSEESDQTAEFSAAEEAVINANLNEGISEATLLDVVTSIGEIKGRGNYTWSLDKKPYQIKFDKKQSVFGMDTAKKWVLLANYTDNSMMRNSLTFDIASGMGMENTSEYCYVDLFVDGQYLGNYLICEKVEIGSSRVELEDNYGVLVELDNMYYQSEDVTFQAQQSESWFVLKESVADDVGEPGSVAEAAFDDFEEYVNKFEKLLYADEKDWNAISSMIDAESFAKMYVVQEFSENSDGCRSSFNLYKDGASDVLHVGPVWDFDVAYGNYVLESCGGNAQIDYMENIRDHVSATNDWLAQLLAIPEFNALVREVYQSCGKTAIESAIATTLEREAFLTQSAKMNFTRWKTQGKESEFWGGHTNKETYTEEVEYLRSWAYQRAAYFEQYADEVRLSYRTHVENVGWQGYRGKGAMAGTSGQALRLEAINIKLKTGLSGAVSYRTHVQNIGWQDWVENGEMSGTSGQSLRLEGIQIQLTGEVAEQYDVYYRVHAQNVGWMGWAKNGESAGTAGLSLRLEGIQIILVEKGGEAPGDVGEIESVESHCFIDASTDCSWLDSAVTYAATAHIQDIGDKSYPVTKGVSALGTTGESKRIEAMSFKSSLPTVQFQYCTHVQNIGWQDWVNDGQLSGTQGQALRLEALRIELVGADAEQYDVYYRTHIENIGWTGWAKNGSECGSAGFAYRMEAVQVVVVPKNAVSPGVIGNAFYQA